jgi:hypothetical protein
MEATTTNQTERTAAMNYNDFTATITEYNLNEEGPIQRLVERLYSDITEYGYIRDRILAEAANVKNYSEKVIKEITDGYRPSTVAFLVGSPIDRLKEYEVKYEMQVEKVRRSISDVARETVDPDGFNAAMIAIAF